MTESKKRELPEIMEMLKEAAEVPGYFEIGPEEAQLLYASLNAKTERSEGTTTNQTMTWHLIFAGEYGGSVQVFATTDDPEQAARELVAQHDWLKGHTLIAAVKGAESIKVRDDAQDSFALQDVSI